ncbi:hypothetical protein KGM_215166 [Danaus plexippus plexippus]|uniref:Uncharacterized protein n=1 Tax=Danaus plexippus plexippus TaxID=278856 RepID=A0A212FBS0_DANPL|nr:hypothetical protein KGM_215166 [Danaus plexippus plexippus]
MFRIARVLPERRSWPRIPSQVTSSGSVVCAVLGLENRERSENSDEYSGREMSPPSALRVRQLTWVVEVGDVPPYRTGPYEKHLNHSKYCNKFSLVSYYDVLSVECGESSVEPAARRWPVILFEVVCSSVRYSLREWSL